MTTGFQVVGSLSAGALATLQGWRGLGAAVVVGSLAAAVSLARKRRRWA
jgi:hypothetical protein